MFVADEETGGAAGARWLTEQHPEKVRCDMLLNEGTGSTRFEIDGQRYYGVCCGEKGIFRFRLTATGQAGHASMPRMGENALLKLAPALQRLRAGSPRPRSHGGGAGADRGARRGSRRARCVTRAPCCQAPPRYR